MQTKQNKFLVLKVLSKTWEEKQKTKYKPRTNIKNNRKAKNSGKYNIYHGPVSKEWRYRVNRGN